MPKGPTGRVVTFAGQPTPPPHDLLLGALEAITRVAAEAESVPSGLHEALAILCATLRWPIGHVYQRVDGPGPTLASATIWHLEEPGQFAAFQDLTAQTTFHPGQGLVGRVLAQRRPGLSPDVTRDRRFLRRHAARADNVHAWLAFPVIAEGQVVAVCELLTTERMPLDRSQLALLSCVGLTLGRLYERDQLRRSIAIAEARAGAAAQASLSELAAAIIHEVNSPLFSARASLTLIEGGPGEQALIAHARADLARIAAAMELLQAIGRSARAGRQLASFGEPPAA